MVPVHDECGKFTVIFSFICNGMQLSDWQKKKSEFSPDLVVFWLIPNYASNIPQLLPQVFSQGLQKHSPVVPVQTKAKYKTL